MQSAISPQCGLDVYEVWWNYHAWFERYAPDKWKIIVFKKGDNSVNMEAGVMVLAHCTPPWCGLDVYKVW